MKMAISFICGIAISCIVVFGIMPVLPTFAGTAETGDNSADNTQSITGTISNFEKIYKEALTEPFIKAEEQIHDADIAAYYRGLMEKTGLTNPQ